MYNTTNTETDGYGRERPRRK